MDLTGAFVSALAPVYAVTCFISARSRPRVPVIDAAGADVSVPVQTTSGYFGLFSSSVDRLIAIYIKRGETYNLRNEKGAN